MDKMKASAIAAVLGSALAGSAFADGHAGPMVYGTVNVSYEIRDFDAVDDADNFELASNASRVGVKGELPAGGLTAFYKVEFAVDVADNAGGIDEGRDQVAGLKGDFGAVMFGRHNTPTKELGKDFDRFNNQYIADIGDVNGQFMAGEVRSEDTLSYMSPNIEGFQAWLMWIPGEETVAGSGSGANDGPADSVSASVKYAANGINVGLSVDSEVAGFDIVRLVGGYSTADFGVSALFQAAEDSATGNFEETTIGLSGQFNIDSANSIKAQFTTTNQEVGASDEDYSTISLGYDHMLSKSSKVYAFYASADDEDVGGGDASSVGIGLEHNF